MTSRLISLYRIFARSEQVHSRSWASAARWRGYFAGNENESGEDEDQHNKNTTDEVNEFHSNSSGELKSDPIQSEDAREARRIFLVEQRRMSALRNNPRDRMFSNDAIPEDRGAMSRPRSEADVISCPNLNIPIANVQCSIAQ